MACIRGVLVGCLAVTSGAFQLPPRLAHPAHRPPEHFTLARCHRAAPREHCGHSIVLRATQISSAEGGAAGELLNVQPSHAHDDGDWLTRLNHKLEGGLGSALLLGSTALSITLANSAFSGVWLDFWNTPTMIQVGHEALSKRGIINEGLMALFFFNVGLEIKQELVGGSLSSWKSALLPCIAAVGGMAVPMLVYALVNLAAGGSMAGVTIPMATDIAFAMGVFGVLSRGKRFPAAVGTFLLTLATVDDLGAILVIAGCFASNINLPFLAAAAAVQAGLIAMERARVATGKAYIVVGAGLWYCLMRAGVCADIAGVCAGLCVHGSKGDLTTIGRLMRRWGAVCGLAIMPLFALANTAVPLGGLGGAAGVLAGGAAPVALGVFWGLVLGKPLGIVTFSWLAVKLGLATYPQGMDGRHLAVIGTLGGIGFTMCIFLIEQSLPVGRASSLSKVAVIAASATSCILAKFAIDRASSLSPAAEPPTVEA